VVRQLFQTMIAARSYVDVIVRTLNLVLRLDIVRKAIGRIRCFLFCVLGQLQFGDAVVLADCDGRGIEARTRDGTT